jgi:hypothetical protein
MFRACLLATALWIALPAAADTGWQACVALTDAGARLACCARSNCGCAGGAGRRCAAAPAAHIGRRLP